MDRLLSIQGGIKFLNTNLCKSSAIYFTLELQTDFIAPL